MRPTSITLFILFVFYSFSICMAQNDHLYKEKRDTRFIKQLGFSLNMGPLIMDLSDLNTQLESLQMPALDNYLYGRRISFLLETDRLGISYNLTFGDTHTSSNLHGSRTSVTLSTINFGFAFERYLLNKKRFNLLAKLGFEYGSLIYTFNRSSQVSVNFSNLHTAPASSALVRLVNHNNYAAPLGLKFAYKTGWLQSIRVSDFNMGMDIGYTYNFIKGQWQEESGNTWVNNMPRVSPDQVYALFSFAFLFNR